MRLDKRVAAPDFLWPSAPCCRALTRPLSAGTITNEANVIALVGDPDAAVVRFGADQHTDIHSGSDQRPCDGPSDKSGGSCDERLHGDVTGDG